MKRLLVLLPVLLIFAGCNEDQEISELKNINAEQRQQVQRLTQAHQETVDQLAIQMNRQAQIEAEKRTDARTHELSTATMIVLSCALAVTLGMLLARRRPNAATNSP